MKCPICGGDVTVVYVRHDCESVGRKRKCKSCSNIFYTMENDCVKSEFYALEGRKSKRRVKQTIREEIILSNIMEKHKLYLNGQTN